jgi:hypothetical protein
MHRRNVAIPAGYDDDSRLVLRFLQATKFNYQQTEDAILEHAKWKRETFPINTSSFMHYLNQGIIYAN